MRVLVAIAIMVLGATAASAADPGAVRGGHGHFIAQYDPIGRSAGQVLIYDWEPGVVVRAYWLRPWHDRHYFPYGHDRWDIRRPTRHWTPPRPAPSFYRYWSTSSYFVDSPPPYWPPLPAQRPPVIDK
jgi:hypothetical protein